MPARRRRDRMLGAAAGDVYKRQARCIARVNNPRNKLIFESLDEQNPVTVISSTEVILDAIHKHVTASV